MPSLGIFDKLKMAEEKKLKIRKKKWYPIIAPALFQNAPLGESLVHDASEMTGKTVTVNLMVLTNDIKKQNINVTFLVTQVDNDKAYAEVVGYEVMQSSIKRLVRKGKKRIDMSFTVETLDQKTFEVKPFLLVRYTIKSSAAKKIQHALKQFLQQYARKLKFEDFMKDLIANKVQHEMINSVKKIYPLRICEIRSVKLLKAKKSAETPSPSKEKTEVIATETPEPKEEVKGEIKEEKPLGVEA